MELRTNPSTFHRHESVVRGYCRRFDAVFASASGSIMRDVDGREYVDFLAACGALNYGHNDPDMRAALIEHIAGDGIAAGLDLYTDVKCAFLERFHESILAPRGYDYRVQFTGPTGANAVEAAMKLARKVTGRNTIFAFTNGFHGVSLGALAATGNQYFRMGASLPGVTRLPFDHYFGPHIDTADYLERFLSDPSSGFDPPAAILLETVQGEGGLNVATSSWLQRIAALAKRHGALLIVDDIQAGCGRTGTFFSFEGMDVVPDVVTMAKSVSGFGLPMAIVLIKPEYDLWRPAEHNGTFRGNTQAFVTARVALEKFWSDKKLSETVGSNAQLITTRLNQMTEIIPDAKLKGRGMMQGISVGSGELAEKITRQCFKRRLILETSGSRDEVIKIMAPLTTPTSLLVHGLDILSEAIAEVIGVTRFPERLGIAEDNRGIATTPQLAPGF